MKDFKNQLSYLITVSHQHFLPAQFLIINLRQKTNSEIVVVGNLNAEEIKLIKGLGARYIDENDIDYSGRLPRVTWQEKYKPFGWYKSMFIRHCIDRFMSSEQVVILDAEVFPFENWDESRFYDPETGNPRSFYWIPQTRKSDWDYKMYRGAAYLLSFLPECQGIMEYANSDHYKRRISGVVLFSLQNVKELWRRLELNTDLEKNIDQLFNHSDLAFSDHDIYGLAVEYGLFDDTVPTVMHNDLLGWYDNHDDRNFHVFKNNAMWSMCQNYAQYSDANTYYNFMQNMASQLHRSLPNQQYWNKADLKLINDTFNQEKGIEYFKKYERQLNYTFRSRFFSMYKALELLYSLRKLNFNIVEIGTLRDNNQGGGHSTYKFGEYCAKFGGTLHTVDILSEAINYSIKASWQYQPWIKYHVQDSEIFLKNFSEKIDLLYLDGFDSTPEKEHEASLKQLKEIQTALPKLQEKCIVLLDDADLPEGGKAKFSSQFLIKNGFELVIDNYQQLYARGFNQNQYQFHESKNEETLAHLEKLISDLPEVYQSIYLHGKLIREGVRKNDFERLEVIKDYIKTGQTVLDIGSNVGFFTINLAKLFPDNVFVSIERQYPYARLQQELIRLEGVKNIILIHSEVDTEWLSKAVKACTYFDVTLLLSVLHHIPDAQNFLTKLNQISKSLIMELPHPDESRVCGKDVLRKQLTFEKINQVKPVFIKMPYEATTHCDTDLKRSFYYADTPNYHRESVYPYIGYPLAPRNYTLKTTKEGLIIHKVHLNQDIKAIPGVLFSDVAQIGRVIFPTYETCMEEIEKEFSQVEKLENVADIRPWNILFTAKGLQFIDYQYTKDLDNHLQFNKYKDFQTIQGYFRRVFQVRLEPQILVDGVFFQLYDTGIARVWRSLLQEWAKTEFANHIVVLDRNNTVPRIRGIRYRSFPPYHYKNKKSDLAKQATLSDRALHATLSDRQLLQQVCDQEKADLFVSTYYTIPLTTPSVFMAYDFVGEILGGNKVKNDPVYIDKTDAIKYASNYISISSNTAKDLNQLFPNIPLESIDLAYCGVDRETFKVATQAEIDAFKYKYGINKPYFMLVNFGGHKNGVLFFKAFAQLPHKQAFDIFSTDANLALPDQYRQYTQGCTYHNVKLSDAELRLAYAGAVALIYPSKYEGFGLPVLEAMACGCPVITTPNASLPEVGGEAVIYVNDNDVHSLASALCEVQKPSVRNRLVNMGLKQAQKFSWAKMAEIVKESLLSAIMPPLNLKEVNYVVFPDWQADEEDLGLELMSVIEKLASQEQSVSLLIESTGIDLEEGNLFLSGVTMNLMLEKEIDIPDNLNISLVEELTQNQWHNLSAKITARIKLENENQSVISKYEASELLSIDYKDNNYLVFPNWQKEEELLGLELIEIIQNLISNHESAYLLIDIRETDSEQANLLLSGIAMNLMLEQEIDISENLNIFLVDQLNENQWQSISKLSQKYKLD